METLFGWFGVELAWSLLGYSVVLLLRKTTGVPFLKTGYFFSSIRAAHYAEDRKERPDTEVRQP